MVGLWFQVSAKKNEEASQISRLQSEVNELKKMLEAQQQGKSLGGVGMTEEEKKALSDQSPQCMDFHYEVFVFVNLDQFDGDLQN